VRSSDRGKLFLASEAFALELGVLSRGTGLAESTVRDDETFHAFALPIDAVAVFMFARAHP
jgi:hypothetical protein